MSAKRESREQQRNEKALPGFASLTPGYGNRRLVGLEPRGLHDRAPFSIVRRHDLREFVGRSNRRVHAYLGELLRDVGRGERLVDATIELVDDRPGRLRRREEPEPAARLHSFQAELVERRYFGESCGAQ